MTTTELSNAQQKQNTLATCAMCAYICLQHAHWQSPLALAHVSEGFQCGDNLWCNAQLTNATPTYRYRALASRIMQMYMRRYVKALILCESKNSRRRCSCIIYKQGNKKNHILIAKALNCVIAIWKTIFQAPRKYLGIDA